MLTYADRPADPLDWFKEFGPSAVLQICKRITKIGNRTNRIIFAAGEEHQVQGVDRTTCSQTPICELPLCDYRKGLNKAVGDLQP